MSNKLRILFYYAFILLLLLTPLSVSAQQNPNPFGGNANTINIGNQLQNRGLGVAPNTTTGSLIASGIQIAFILAILAVLVFLIWGAFDWITAGGDKEKIAGARRKIVNALIGLVILALARFIVVFFGELVGINPFNMGTIPQLGQPNP